MQDARSVVDPKDCALIIGITYFISAILSLILKAGHMAAINSSPILNPFNIREKPK